MTDAKVYRAIVRFINEHKYSPSYRELCELTGFASASTICYAVRRLEEKGLISRDAKYSNRGIVLTGIHPDCDVVAVRHGHWIYFTGINHDVQCKCSECLTSYGHMDTPYCPNCGAKMDGKAEHQ